MGEHYSASRIGADDADLAFPLLSLRYPDLSLQGWRKTVRRLTRMPREHGGLVMVRDLRGRVFAVFAYRSGGTLDGRNVLRVSDVLMGRLPGDLLPSAVVAAATQLAGDRGPPPVAIEYADARTAGACWSGRRPRSAEAVRRRPVSLRLLRPRDGWGWPLPWARKPHDASPFQLFTPPRSELASVIDGNSPSVTKRPKSYGLAQAQANRRSRDAMSASLGSGEASLPSQFGRAATGRCPRRCDRLVHGIGGNGRVVHLGCSVLGHVLQADTSASGLPTTAVA